MTICAAKNFTGISTSPYRRIPAGNRIASVIFRPRGLAPRYPEEANREAVPAPSDVSSRAT